MTRCHTDLTVLARVVNLVSASLVGLLCPATIAQDAAAAARPAPIAELECEQVNGRLYVPMDVAGHRISAVLDTGAGASLLDLALAEEWKLPSTPGLKAHGAGSAVIEGRILEDVTAQIGGVGTSLPYALPLGPLAEMEGRPMQAIIGLELFAQHVVEFDYAARRVRLYDKDAEFTPKGAVLPLRLVEGRPQTTALVTIDGEERSLDAMIDTGASNSGLSARYLAAHPLDAPTTPSCTIGGGIGGAVKGRLFRPDSVQLGDLRCARPVLSMAESTEGMWGSDSKFELLVGADMLGRCRVIVDYPRQRLLVEPGPDAQRPFDADRSGLGLRAHGEDLRTFVVFDVLAGSAAEAAGVQAGDVIESIDGRPARELELQELRKVFRAPDAKSWTLKLKRGEAAVEVKVEARAVI